MIVSVSRRKDIPAFYTEWFMRRIREQYCTVVNPFNRKQVSRVSLSPCDVDAFVFWTKNALPLLPWLKELDDRGYRYYFQYTINGYDQVFEPNVPPLEQRIETFLALAERIGAEKVIWRYDPIILSNRTDPSYHQEQFSYILERLHSVIPRVVISIVDDYRKASINFRRLLAQGIKIKMVETSEQVQNLCLFMSQQVQSWQIPIYSCAEILDLSSFGILPGKCIDANLLRNLFGIRMTETKDKSQRKECGCVKSKDIGFYDTCLHGCAYCYAGTVESATRNRLRHEIDSPSLLGRFEG